MGSLGWKLTDYSSSSDASQYRMHECSSTLYSYFPFTHNFLKYDYWLMEGPFPRYISFTWTRRWSSYLPFWRTAIVWEGFDLLRFCISPNVEHLKPPFLNALCVAVAYSVEQSNPAQEVMSSILCRSLFWTGQNPKHFRSIVGKLAE